MHLGMYENGVHPRKGNFKTGNWQFINGITVEVPNAMVEVTGEQSQW
jgi:hypothetical protein